MPLLDLIRASVAVTAAAAVALTGCGGKQSTSSDRAKALAAQRAAAKAAVPLDAQRAAARPAPPIVTIAGSTPHTQLSLLELRRTGPRFVTARMRISLDRRATSYWTPDLEGDDGTWFTAEGLRLVDEVSGREHRPFGDADGNCVCSTDIEGLDPGESMVISAKFLAPPKALRVASVHVPGFPSIDGIPVADPYGALREGEES